MITDIFMGNQANENSDAILPRKVSVELLKCCRISNTERCRSFSVKLAPAAKPIQYYL